MAHGGGRHPEPIFYGTHPGGRRVLSTSCTRRGDRGTTLGTHTPPTPTPIPTPTQPLTPPPPTSTSKGVDQPRGQQIPHGCTYSTGVVSAGDIECRCPRLCRRAAGSGDGGSGGGPTLPFTHRSLREGSIVLTTPPLLRMRGGRRCVPPSHLRGGDPHEVSHGGACHPQPDLVEGVPLLLVGLQGGGGTYLFERSEEVCI